MLAAAQGPSTVSSSMELEASGHRAHPTDAGDLLVSEIGFDLEYEYERGATTTESTEIVAEVRKAPAGFQVSLDPSHMQADVEPEGGGVSKELQVILVPRVDSGNASKVPAFGVVKVAAYADDNGNVESSSAEAQQLVPLRNASASEPSGGSSSLAATSAGASGTGAAPLAAIGLVSGLVGAVAGALSVRRFD